MQAAVTQPDRPAGRGQKLTPTPVKRAAKALGIPVHEPQNLRAFAAGLLQSDYDLFALASYGKILPQQLLDVPRVGALNVHPSLLPAYRGATPLQSALRDGATQTGVSIMLMDAGMDTGPLLLQSPEPIEPDDTYGSLHDRLAERGAQLLVEAIRALAAGRAHPYQQNGVASVTRPVQKSDLEIDWAWDAARIVNTVRAFSPQPGARATIEGESLKVINARIGDDAAGFVVRAGDGQPVCILEVIAPNRGRMSGAQFAQRLRGAAS